MKASFRIRTDAAVASLIILALPLSAAGDSVETNNASHVHSVAPTDTAQPKGEPDIDADRRGHAEAERLQDELLEQIAPTEVDPSQTLPPEVAGPPVLETPKKRVPFILYASVRVHAVSDQSTTTVEDGASRVGLLAARKLSRGAKIFALAELGFNVVDQFNALTTPDANAPERFQGNAFNPRLYYAGYERGRYRGLVGKNWSPYYAVAGMTDRFGIFGGVGAGVYNAGTDGGGSGTGRADHALQLNVSNDEWTLGLQGQARTEIPTFSRRFDYGLGAAVLHTTNYGIELGAAYNRAVPEDIDQAMRAQGFEGTDETWALSTRFSHGPLLAAATYARSRNHEADAEKRFFNAEGFEIFSRYDIRPVLRAVAGWNYLHPRDDNYGGLARIDQYIVGLHYTFHRKTFEDMVYFEYRFDDGRPGSGEPRDDTLAIGVRYKFTW